MNKTQLLKKLLPGFIPLFVFIAADEIWGTKIGLYVAVTVGTVEILWVGFREKRFDKFIFFDTLLLVVLGFISIVLDNDIFFKLKPGLIELILVAVLAVSAFSPVNIVEVMSRRYLKTTSFSEAQISQMRKTLKRMFFIFMGHTILVFYATFFMSNEAWAFVSGGLFYILFGAYFLYEFLNQKRKRNQYRKEEWVPLVDIEGKITGKVPRSRVHDGSKLLHPVVHMQVIGRNKTILLQKRSSKKLVFPNTWDVAVGGHISAGETLEVALKKETFEELGLKEFSAKLVKMFKWESELEAELVYLFVTHNSGVSNIHSDEVSEVKYWTVNQIIEQLGRGVFTPNFEYEFSLLRELGMV